MKQITNYSKTGTIVSNTVLVGPLDVSSSSRSTDNYVTLQIVSLGTNLRLQIQSSMDGTYWTGIWAAQGGVSGVYGECTSPGHWYANIPGRFVRVIASAAATANNTIVNVSVQSGSINFPAASPAAISAGNNHIGSVTPDTYIGTAANSATVYRLQACAAGANATVVRASSARLYSVRAENNTAAKKYIKLYNKATAPVPGTDVPVLVLPIPANGILDTAVCCIYGHLFTAGLSYNVGYSPLDTDTGASVSANDVCSIHLHYCT